MIKYILKLFQPPMMQHPSMRYRIPIQGMQQLIQGMQPLMGMDYYGYGIPIQQGGPFGLRQQGPPYPYEDQWNGPYQQMGDYF